jgi:capsular polysaccharide biosynthesis protein
MSHSVDNNSLAREEAAREVHQALVQYLSRQSDLGLDKMLLNLALEPASPFDPQARRNFKKGFVLALLIALGLAVTFFYFNFFAGGQ